MSGATLRGPAPGPTRVAQSFHDAENFENHRIKCIPYLSKMRKLWTTTAQRKIARAETLSMLYLLAPVLVFSAFFLRIELALPACALIAYEIWTLVRHTCWRKRTLHLWEVIFYLVLSGIWVWLSGGFGPPHQAGDWLKHYAIINLLVEHPWPARVTTQQFGNSVLRFYSAWYLVPALAAKVSGIRLQYIALAVWTFLGTFLFFSLLPGIVGARRAAIAAPIVFMLYGPPCIIGKLITGVPLPALDLWSGWVAYSSNFGSLTWTPHHALPAWIGVALLTRCYSNISLLPFIAFLMSAIVLWSPFIALGLVPFFVVLLVKHGIRAAIASWRAIAATALIGVPLVVYLTADTGGILSGFIGNHPCTFIEDLCFSWPSYARFVLVETAAPLLILFLPASTEETGFLIAAAIVLFAVPLYRVGGANDFALRVPLPALAFLSILSARLLAWNSRRYRIAILLLLALALPTSVVELVDTFLGRPYVSPNTTFSDLTDGMTPETRRVFWNQYFSTKPIWVLRGGPSQSPNACCPTSD